MRNPCSLLASKTIRWFCNGMDEAALINRIWLILALSCPSTYYLYTENNDWFLATAFLGGMAVIHAERKALYCGWDSGIVLLAHALAILTLFGVPFVAIIFYGSGLFADRNTALTVIGFGNFFASGTLAAILHSKVQDHYDKFRT